MPQLHWLDAETLEIDNQRYSVIASVDSMRDLQSSAKCLTLAKPRHMLERFHEQFRDKRVDNVVELTMSEGGSTAFYQQVLSPKKLVALDVNPGPAQALELFVSSRSLQNIIHPYYGVAQGDRALISGITDREFSGEGLDLVIDDASHLYAESRASFEVLFPRLRPGGSYILDNWAWAHLPDDLFQRPDGLRADRPALTNLIVEAMLVMGSFPDIVSEVKLDHNEAHFVRGERKLPNCIELSCLYLNRGRLFRPLL